VILNNTSPSSAISAADQQIDQLNQSSQ